MGRTKRAALFCPIGPKQAAVLFGPAGPKLDADQKIRDRAVNPVFLQTLGPVLYRNVMF